jgi:hypothetical protein
VHVTSSNSSSVVPLKLRNSSEFQVKVKDTLRLTVSQQVLVSSPIRGSWPDIYSCSTVTVLFFVGRPLWRNDGSVFCICCWSLPAQAFSGPSPFVLATIFYCLRFETSLFVASYDSQGDGGSIRPRLHTSKSIQSQSQSQNESHIATDGQSVSLTRYLLLFDS